MLGLGWRCWSYVGSSWAQSLGTKAFDVDQWFVEANLAPAIVAWARLWSLGGRDVYVRVKGGSRHCLFVAPLSECQASRRAAAGAA
jgi:hypothetical protein